MGGRRRARGVDAAIGLPLRQAHMLDHHQIRLGQHQFQRGGQQLLRVVLLDRVLRRGRARPQVQHQRHLAVVGRQLGDHAGGLGREHAAYLDRLYRHVFEQAARLVVEQVGRDRVDVLDAGGVLHRQCGDGCQAMTAQLRAGHGVGRQAIGAGGVQGTQNQYERGVTAVTEGWAGRGGMLSLLCIRRHPDGVSVRYAHSNGCDSCFAPAGAGRTEN